MGDALGTKCTFHRFTAKFHLRPLIKAPRPPAGGEAGEGASDGDGATPDARNSCDLTSVWSNDTNAMPTAAKVIKLILINLLMGVEVRRRMLMCKGSE
jgi:hypothetical protein